jgi:ABC-type Fe3+-hydroxamate transport system substrate-binding protein
MSDRDREIEHRLTKVEEACALIPKMAEQMDAMAQKLAKYDGRWGTLLMVGTALWAMFAAFKDSIIGWIKNG